MNYHEKLNKDLGKNTKLEEGEQFGQLICPFCGTEEIWPQEVDHEDFPMDVEWEVTPDTIWVCINDHVFWIVKQEIIQAGAPNYKVVREV